MLLPTDSKDKIGRNLAYPVGAELISRAVGGIPQAAQTSIVFREKITVRASDFNEILRDATEYVIVQCECKMTDWYAYPTSFTWRITVFPVLRDLKAAAREALVQDGLPQLKEFLWQTSTKEGRQKRVFLAIKFDPIEKRVYC